MIISIRFLQIITCALLRYKTLRATQSLHVQTEVLHVDFRNLYLIRYLCNNIKLFKVEYNMVLSILAFGMPGGWELVVIVLVVVLLFGAKKIPELAKGLGKGIREFKDASKEIKDEIQEGIKEDKK